MSVWTEREERLVTLQARAERRRKRRKATLTVVGYFAPPFGTTPKVERWSALHREADTLARKLWQARVEEGTRRMALAFNDERQVATVVEVEP